MIIPDPRLWNGDDRRVSFRKALRQEYSGFYVIVVFFTAIEAKCDILGSGQSALYWLQDDLGWGVFFLFGTAAYLGLRLMRHHTSMLADPEPATAMKARGSARSIRRRG